VAMGQISRSTERISSYYYHLNHLLQSSSIVLCCLQHIHDRLSLNSWFHAALSNRSSSFTFSITSCNNSVSLPHHHNHHIAVS